MRKIACTTALLALALINTSCSVFKTSMASFSVEESRKSSSGTLTRTLETAEARDLLSKVRDHAEFSAVVYRRDIPDPVARSTEGCNYVKSGVGGVPSHLLPAGWRPLDDALLRSLQIDADSVIPCRASKGLEYETYVLVEKSQVTRAVIAIRGTENDKVSGIGDWLTSSTGLFLGTTESAQYKTAREDIGQLIKTLANRLPSIPPSAKCREAGPGARPQAPIELVGHSLGGGLAQHVAYTRSACEVMQTVTFNSSPVTGWFYLNEKELVLTKDPDIFRFYMNGEFLEKVRALTTKFNLPREGRVDYQLNFPGISGNFVELHSMDHLASCIGMWSNEPPLTQWCVVASADGRK
jgi:hypothetical protein